MSIKVTIADDHPVVVEGIRNILQEDKRIEVLDCCKDAETMLAALKKRQPDVVLLDIQMPGQQGDEISKIITAKYPAIAILTLTNLNQTFHVRNMFLNGARGYLLKSTDKHTLLQAIETVHKGEQYVDASLREQMLYEMIETRAKGNSIPVLTHREKEIMNLIAAEMTSQEIAKKLFISLSAVENHRLNLLSKLGVKNAVGLVRKAIQMGIIK